MDDKRTRTRATIGGAVVAVVMGAAILVWGPAGDADAPPATHDMFDADGELALAMPSLADDITVTANDDGSSEVRFSVTYDVAHPGEADAPTKVVGGESVAPPATTAKPDMGAVTVQVSEAMGPNGPIRLSPLTKETQLDRRLVEASTTSSYSFRLNPATTTFLDGKGLGSSDAATRDAALRYIDIDVQHLRDWKVVDGTYDWQQGRGYTAQDGPVAGATITDQSTLTVTNDTSSGVWGPSFDDLDDTAGKYEYGRWDEVLADTPALATPITMSGQAIECIDQGGGSNPQGFSMLNGWDIEDDLPPGLLPPGASVTQQINADDGLGTSSLDIAQQTTTAAVQVLAAALGTTTPGLKSAISTGVQLAMGVTSFADPITLALAVPIKAILELVDGIYKAMTNSCASFANVFNLTVAEPTGAGTSVSWGDQSDGLDLTYSSASYGGSPVTDNVSTVPSNGLFTTLMEGATTPYAFNPYLEQAATVSCGDSEGTGDGGGCDGTSGHNVIDVRWTTAPMCPYGDQADCTPTPSEISSLPEVSVPGTDLCGTGNALCTTYPAPNADAQDASDTALEGEGYQVLLERNPEHPITAITATDDGEVWYSDDQGDIWNLQDFGTPFLRFANDAGAITAMTASGTDLLYTAGSDLFVQDTTSSGGSDAYSTPQPVEHIQWDGNSTAYLASESDLFAWTEGADEVVDIGTEGWDVDGASITSLTASADSLFVGFDQGQVERCSLWDCSGTWQQVHDAGFSSAAQALTTVGGTLYVGLANGAVAMVDPDTTQTRMVQDPLTQDGEVAGLLGVDGNVFIGGCLSNEDPVSGDWLGLEVFTGWDSDGDVQFNPELMYDSCQNPASSTSKLKGFSASDYALFSTPATAEHPLLVYLAQDISTESYLYVLESTNPYTSSTCVPATGGCPTAPTPPPSTVVTPTAVGSLGSLGTPVMASTCSGDADDWYTAATTDAPLTTAAGESVTSGFALSPPDDSDGCTTIYTWNLNNSGSLLYDTWQANAYPASSGSSGSSATTLGIAQDWNAGLPVEVGGASIATGAQPLFDFEVSDGTNGAAPTAAPIATGGSQLQVDLSGPAPMLVLSLTTAAGEQATPLVVTHDTLTSQGQTAPPAVPLFTPPPTTTTTTTTTTAPTTTASSSSTTTTTTSTTTTPSTTTTTRPAGCTVPAVPTGSSASALWPLDDRSTTARDVSGHGNDATIADATAYDQAPGPLTACPQDGGLAFDGSTTHVTAPAEVDVTRDQATVMAFVDPAATSDGVATVLADDDPGTTGDGVALEVATDAGTITGVTFSLGLSSGPISVAPSTSLSADGWHLLVGTWDATSGTATLYADGQPVGTATAPAGATIAAGSQPVTVGVDPTDETGWFAGRMADVAVLDQALTASQVAAVWGASGT